MSEQDKIRENVSKAYARAVESPTPPPGDSGAPVQKGVAVKSAGYHDADLESLPRDAVENSFGCGNPLAFSDVAEGDVVVDLGSGAGIDVLLAAKKVGPTGRAIGIDMTDEMIARARANIAASGVTNAEIRKGTVENLPVDDDSVDWVISNCVINLSPEKPKVYAEIARVLKPGGCMIVTDIVASDLPSWVLNDKALHASCLAGAIDEETYLDGLRQAGLEEVEVRERVVYDQALLEPFIASELPGGTQSACCPEESSGGASSGISSVADAAKSLVGKVSSVKIFARKPR